MAYGTLLGNPVMVVASGIGPTTAALCALELLQCRSGMHLTSLTPLANQVACLSCATLHTCRAVHTDCSMLMPSPNLYERVIWTLHKLSKPACAGSSGGDLQQICMLPEKVDVEATIAVQQ